MKKIAIDCSKLNTHYKTGTHRFLIGFLNELIKRKENKYYFYFSEEVKNNSDFEFLGSGEVVIIKSPFFTQIGLLGELGKYDIFIFPWQTLPYLGFLSKTSKIAIIHDFGFSFRSILTTFLTQIFADKLFSVSSFTANKLLRKSFLITEGVDKNIFYKIKDTELGKLRKENKLPEQFILSLGRIEERKNIYNNLLAFKKVSKFYPNLFYCFIGSFSIPEDKIYSFMTDHKIDRSKILFKNYLSDFEVNLYLNSCEFLVFTSKDEGFGLPVIEAYSVDKAVILSKNRQLAQLSLSANQLTSYDSPKEIADKMIYFLTNKSKVKKELDFDLILSKYSWKESVKMFMEGLKSNEN